MHHSIEVSAGTKSNQMAVTVNNRELGKRVLVHIKRRQAQGIEIYGEMFQGNPLEHLREELIDALFYIEALAVEIEDIKANHGKQ